LVARLPGVHYDKMNKDQAQQYDQNGLLVTNYQFGDINSIVQWF